MGLWQKIKNIGREKASQAEDALTDHVRDGKFAIVDAKKERDEFRGTISKLSASIKRLELQQGDAKAEVKKWSGFAAKAAEAGNETDLEECATKELQFKAQADELGKQITKNTDSKNALKKQLDKISSQIARAEQNFTVLAARKQGAEARTNLAKASAGMSNGKGLAALDDLENAVREEECEAEAIEELTTPDSADMEDKYGGASDDASALMDKYRKKAAK